MLIIRLYANLANIDLGIEMKCKERDILLSIIIPVYNGHDTICTLLESIAMQSIVHNFEIIVVDDNSNDGTSELVKKWSRRKGIPIKCISNAQNLGAMLSRLRGFTLSHAEYILFADADDRILGVNRIEKAVAIAVNKQVDILHGHTISVIKGTGRREEVDWTAPIPGNLEKPDLFYTFFSSKSYPPIHLWAKIFSRRLFNIVYEKAKNVHIYRFDDKFLMSLAAFYANSYMPYDEYIYEYGQNNKIPCERIPARIHDFCKIMETMRPLLDSINNLDAKYAYYNFISKRLAYNVGKLCIEVDKFKTIKNQNERYLFDWIGHRVDGNIFLQALLFSINYNLEKINKITQILCLDIPKEFFFKKTYLFLENEGFKDNFIKNFSIENVFNIKLDDILLTRELISKMISINAKLARVIQDIFHSIL